ncbi:hypothetical protein [Sphingopyxis sp. MWB1]|uniref:hypothetical protein n=1 Tax=Sphingopyxis sp. MWB1 TaxID=1537715 RepID=UPI00068EC173|nr:hypothetical protein [Sphingopyxis sp. MWB1]
MTGPKLSSFNLSNGTGPFAPDQTNGGVTTEVLAIVGNGASYSSGRLHLPAGTSLDAGAAGITLPTDPDPALTQTPASCALVWTGILPSEEVVLVSLYKWEQARFALYSHWEPGKLRLNIERNGNSAMIDSIGGISTTQECRIEVRWDDDEGGPGGTITFLVDGIVHGSPHSLGFKLRITPDCRLECNASLGNTANSGAQQLSQIQLRLGVSDDPTPPDPGDLTVYGEPGTRFPLNLDMEGASGDYDLTIASDLSLVRRDIDAVPKMVGTAYIFSQVASSYDPVQTNGGVTVNNLDMIGTGASYGNGRLQLQAGTYLSAHELGISLPTTADPATSQAPRVIVARFKGILPQHGAPLVSLYHYAHAQFSLHGYWQPGRVKLLVERDGQTATLYSVAGLSNSIEEDVAVRYEDDPQGPGGTVTFLRGGSPFGPSQTLPFKPRVTPEAIFECNASLDNVSNSVDLEVREVSLELEQLAQGDTFTPISSGPIRASDLERLYVDALAVPVPQPAKTLSYSPVGGGTPSTVNVIIGPIDVPAGTAYRAILEDWSGASPVDHADMLVMTRPSRQNCQFEDPLLRANQPRWMECLPQGPVPEIAGIAYYCEAIRTPDYVQFQFGYDWAPSAMPDNPFGDPTGKDSYMIPHKWRIEDKNGVVLAHVERPDGGPLNGTDIPHIFEGSYDGYGVAITSDSDRWYPHGTVRAGVIWRSRTPTAYDQAFINANLPRYDVTIGYASHTHYSNNGFDGRLWGGGSSNGFGNTRVMPYEPTSYAALTPLVGVTSDPWKGSLYNFTSLAAVASTWLRYTPFNQCGRSPITGPGGVRDDRAAIAEPVGQYIHDISANRPHDGKPWSVIALDYLTAYVSDPYHAFEKGRCTPLFKGSNASRDIGLRNHYYGYGEASRPANRSWYLQGGRPYAMADSYSPWLAKVPYAGVSSRKPYFGTNEIDLPHAHQFPHWGSLLWQTPEFAFLGHKLSDQGRLYENWILSGRFGGASNFAERGAAWQFLHSALIWKSASRTSGRLYSREEILAFVVQDFEAFSDTHKSAVPGFDNPPSNVMVNGQIDEDRVVYAGTQYFGVCGWRDGTVLAQHDFYIGYWLTALGIAERIGFNSAVRSASAKAGGVIDWLIAQHRKRVVGRINEAPRANPGGEAPYMLHLWDESAITAANGDVASLPQSYAAIAVQNGNAARWDIFDYGGSSHSRDGQAMDQLIAGPSVLRIHLGQQGSDLAAAETTAESWRNEKKVEQEALGPNGAGTSWFKYLQSVHNPAIS